MYEAMKSKQVVTLQPGSGICIWKLHFNIYSFLIAILLLALAVKKKRRTLLHPCWRSKSSECLSSTYAPSSKTHKSFSRFLKPVILFFLLPFFQIKLQFLAMASNVTVSNPWTRDGKSWQKLSLTLSLYFIYFHSPISGVSVARTARSRTSWKTSSWATR